MFVIPGIIKNNIEAGWLAVGVCCGLLLLIGALSSICREARGLEDQRVLPTEHLVSQLLLHLQNPQVLLLAC